MRKPPIFRLPPLNARNDVLQAKAYQTIDFTGNEEESSAAIETAIALVAEAEAIHTTCSRGIVEHRKEKARFDSLAKQVEEKKAEITSVANGVFQVSCSLASSHRELQIL